MVVKMMKWRPWPSKKFEAKITLHELKLLQDQDYSSSRLFCVEIKWKGSKGISLSSLRRRGLRRNFTKDESLGQNGVVQWNEEFRCVCSLSANTKDGVFNPWEVSFSVFDGLKQGTNNNAPILGSASLNLADFVEKQHTEINIPLTLPDGTIDTNMSLNISVILQELRNNTEKPSEPIPRPMLLFPRSPCYGEMFSTTDKEDTISSFKTSPLRVNIFKGLNALRSKRTSHEEEGSDGRSSMDIDFNSPLETDSLDDSDEVDSEGTRVEKSFDYGTLAYANRARASIQANTSSSDDEDLIYYSHRKSDIGQMYGGDASGSVSEHSPQQNRKHRLIPWRKRKLSFTSPKGKGEPLLKKDYREDGGDDIDFDRRQLSSSDESTSRKAGENSVANQQSISEFGDDNFAVGAWEEKEIISRDGEMKLKTQVFFASIDQRNERAAGESACTALVAVIADWFQYNHEQMPIKSQLDTLIREGSLEWRNLCENENYKERFPDKHFDLETILEAKIRPICVVPQKSFIGFFQTEGFDFLHGAMSFDNIWDEICQFGSEVSTSSDPLVYIISWNDHFFVLKVETDAYYIIDTLGERLYEGCNQAFILKFDKDTIILNETRVKAEKSETEEVKVVKKEESNIVCTGKESCKEYIKRFLAAIPIRELQVDLKKGLMASTPLHHRLQIEFHYTRYMDQCPVEEEVIDDITETLPTTGG